MAALGIGAAYIDFRTTGALPLRHEWGPLATFVALFHLIPGATITVRRLHDMGKSGWWYLLILVPFGALVLLFWMCCASEAGSNAYGDPVGSADREPELSPIIRRALRTNGPRASAPLRTRNDSSQERFI